MTIRQFCRLVLVAQCLIALFLILPAPTVHATEGHVYISEIAWAGSSLSTADEWLELANPSDLSINLAGWRLTGAGSSDKTLVLPSNAIIPAGGAYLIANYAETDTRSSLIIHPDCVSTTVALANDKLLIQLWDSNGQLIDQAGDGQAPPAGYSSGIKASMIRTDSLVDGSLSTSWKTADASQNLKTQDFGTPGNLDIKPSSEGLTTTIGSGGTSTGSSTALVTGDATSTTSATTTSVITATSTDQSLLSQDAATTGQSTVVAAPSSSTPTPTQSDVQLLRLNEIMPNPAEGSEWAEILSAAPDRTISLDGVELHDKSGRIATLSGEVSSTQPFFVYTLHSARFNNDGDSIYLIADGQVIDTLTYGGSHKGYSWAVDEHGAWQETTTPTPRAANLITLRVAETDNTNLDEEIAISASAPTTATTNAPAPAASSITKATTLTTPKAVNTTAKAVAQKTTVSTTAKTVSKAAAPKKTTTKAKPIIPLDFNMLQDDEYGGLRVRLQGTVSTPPRLLTGRAFVLTNPEGRGLLVKLSADKKLPMIGTQMAVVGTLKFDTHELPYLSVSKTDTLSELKTSVSASSTPREVAWLAPAAEDAWSLVTASGTVQSVSGATINLLVDDVEVNVKIRPGVAYRASRLKKGDIILVSGVLDISGDRPAILPRSADEIKLISYASKKIQTATATTHNGLPGWTPFGVALGAIGAVEGVKKIRTKKKRVMKEKE